MRAGSLRAMRALRALAALSAAVTLLATGCGGGDDATVALEATPAGLARAATATLDGTSGRFSASVSGAMNGSPATLALDGSFDDAGRLELLVDVGQLFGALAGGGLPPGLDSTEPMRMVVDGGATYLCWPGFATLTGGRACGTVDLGGLASGAVSDDPRVFLRVIAGADSVTEVGHEDVDGTETTHLAGTLTMRHALEQLPPAQADAITAQLTPTMNGSVEAGLDAPIPFDVWIDGEGRVRRFSQTIDRAAFGDPSSGPLSVDLRFRGFGDDIDIAVPDPADVADLADLFGAMFGDITIPE